MAASRACRVFNLLSKSSSIAGDEKSVYASVLEPIAMAQRVEVQLCAGESARAVSRVEKAVAKSGGTWDGGRLAVTAADSTSVAVKSCPPMPDMMRTRRSMAEPPSWCSSAALSIMPLISSA